MRVADNVVYRELSEETILLSVATGRYHGLDKVGARFFQVLLDSPDLGTACETLAREYEQPLDRIQADMSAFCDTLQRLGLIVLQRPS